MTHTYQGNDTFIEVLLHLYMPNRIVVKDRPSARLLIRLVHISNPLLAQVRPIALKLDVLSTIQAKSPIRHAALLAPTVVQLSRPSEA